MAGLPVLDFRGDFLFNGIAAHPGDVFMTSVSSGYITMGERRNTLAIGIRRSRLEPAMRALSGGAEVPTLRDQHMVLERAQSDNLMQVALATMQSAVSHRPA